MTAPPPGGTLVLTRRDVASVLGMRDCIDAVERAFRLHAEGTTIAPGVLGAHVEGGGFHVKTAGLLAGERLFAAKVNANFPANPARHGLPTIQGVVVLFDAEAGRPLAVLDSIEITSLRTAAATAVAARHLAREDAGVVTVCGCGEQGRSQLRALAEVRPLRTVLAFDADAARAERFAREMTRQLGLDVSATHDLRAAARRSDMVVTCTPARRWLLGPDDVAPGTFVAAVGADHPEKQEIAPALLAASTVVVDVLEQCAAIGDLHHALDAGTMTRADVHAELADVVSGRKPGRRSAEEIVVFDSTGTALQDVAAAWLVYERARARGVGIAVDLGGTAAMADAASHVPRVLFVCLHGSAKSVIAAEQLRRLAAQRGMRVESASAGVEPDAEIPPHVVAALAGEGIDVRGRRPAPVTDEALAAADHVVTFGCELDRAPERAEVVTWHDVPAVSDGYAAARAAIVDRLVPFLDALAARQPRVDRGVGASSSGGP